ncbi:SufS family cysteine desulfurase [Thiocapsa marina]|uniref:cysteine desulfurase n=1 Tax=Thiocapsa marina 5811 TaxID=768671 RepID=F9U505_9GAMM|nr:SufS family cysteine desulfurase [Thiocapsa marina]EGV20228.1 cysteine desulfurase, SufS subfamily [Thiocapsa marina 5811]
MTPRLSPTPAPSVPLDLTALRAQFPILATRVHDQPLAYLDNAASTQQPLQVIQAVSDYHQQYHANIHRGVYQLSRNATRMHDYAREMVAHFLHAAEPVECLFTRGTTESINLVASSWGRAKLTCGDEIILSNLEHHSNIVPWQMVCEATGARIRVIPIDDSGELDMDAYRRLLSSRTRLVAVNHVSNALGTINPVKAIIEEAHAAGALALIDGAQWVSHGATDVQALDADFYAFSGHKLYGPTGMGVLYGKRALLEAMPPYQGGGDMIEQVTFEKTTYAQIPNKFEAGTPHIAGAVGLAAAIEWLEGVGFERIHAHEQRLLRQVTERLSAIPGLEIKGTAPQKAAVVSWVMVDPPIGTLDIGMQLDLRGICIRTGHHCCQPLMDRLGIASTARASFGAYNTEAEVERLADALAEIVSVARDASARKGRTETPPAEILYPVAVADSPASAAEEIAEIFDLLPDWPMRHQQIMDLGERLTPMPDALKTPETFVPGCQSRVHLSARVRPGSTDVIEFLADSDANIVRGLIALLQQLYSGQKAGAILAFDAQAFFSRLGLDDHLSMTRRNGLVAMVERIRQIAAGLGR